MLITIALALLVLSYIFSLRKQNGKYFSHIFLLVFLIILACYNPTTYETYENVTQAIVEKFAVREDFDGEHILNHNKISHLINSSNQETEEEEGTNNLRQSAEHIELAYKLCSDPQVREPKCHKFRRDFESLKNSYKELKTDYCRKHTHVCEELGI